MDELYNHYLYGHWAIDGYSVLNGLMLPDFAVSKYALQKGARPEKRVQSITNFLTKNPVEEAKQLLKNPIKLLRPKPLSDFELTNLDIATYTGYETLFIYIQDQVRVRNLKYFINLSNEKGNDEAVRAYTKRCTKMFNLGMHLFPDITEKETNKIFSEINKIIIKNNVSIFLPKNERELLNEYYGKIKKLVTKMGEKSNFRKTRR